MLRRACCHSSVLICAQGRAREPVLASWTLLDEEHGHPLVSGVPILLQFLDHLGEHQCRRGVRVGQKKGLFFGSSDWMLAEVLPEPMGLLPQSNCWAGGTTGII